MIPSQLPSYLGKYNVGCVDVETRPTLQSPDGINQGVLFRIYYPIDDTPTNSQKAAWLPLNHSYFDGYAFLLTIGGLPTWFSYILFFPAMYAMRLAAYYGARVAEQSVPKKLPVIVFSHGLAGIRTSYSTMCGNLASEGYIVASLEHGDGSAPVTCRARSNIPYIRFKRQMDFDPLPDESQDDTIRRCRGKQLAFRCEEIQEVISVLKRLNKGTFARHYKQSPLHSFKSRIDFDNMVGGSTLITLMNMPNPPDFKYSIILDPWLFPIDESSKVKIPTLHIQSNYFHWKENLESIEKLVKQNENHPKSEFVVLKGTKHDHCSDLGFVFPKLYKYVEYRGLPSPADSHKLIHHLINLFLKRTIPVHVPVDEKLNHVVHEHTLYGDQAFELLYQTARPKPPLP
ncbi:Platelet-activating factor acetylhydrolase [Globomyces sp. JEL0801]|nr:Platelet-activating factor acetylhydrolase [Globomyces sp. JEL0801]